MEAVVLGGGGLTGRCTVRDLARGGRFDSIRVADLDVKLAEGAARAAGDPRVTFEGLDVRDPPALRRTLAGASVCVNAVQYTFNLAVMEGCLAARVPYLDFGGLFHMTRRQLELDGRFRDAGIPAIPGLGQVPGVSNVLAAAAARRMERVDSIVFRDGWRDLTVGGPELYFTWSPSTFLDEMEMPAQVWEEGRYVAAPPMSAAEEFEFAEPVGRTRVFRTLHSEPATLPQSLASLGLRHCEWKEGGPGIDLLRQLAQLGLGKRESVTVGGVPVSPREFLLALLKHEKLLGVPAGVTVDDWEVLDIELRGVRGGRSVEDHVVVRFPPKPEWSLTATEYGVGVVGAIGAEMLASGAIRTTGVQPPEQCVPVGPFRTALTERGIESRLGPDEGPLPPFRPGPPGAPP